MKKFINQRSITPIIAWMSLLIASAAFLLALAAYNRSTIDLGNVSVSQPSASDQQQFEVALAKANTSLQALKPRLEAGESPQVLESEVVKIRSELASSHASASAQTALFYSDIDNDLSSLQQEVREKSAHALSTLEMILLKTRNAITSGDDI